MLVVPKPRLSELLKLILLLTTSDNNLGTRFR